MGDAVLGLLARQMGKGAPCWLAIRDLCDPQIKAEGTLRQQAQGLWALDLGVQRHLLLGQHRGGVTAGRARAAA